MVSLKHSDLEKVFWFFRIYLRFVCLQAEVEKGSSDARDFSSLF